MSQAREVLHLAASRQAVVDLGDVQRVPGVGDIHKMMGVASKGHNICCWRDQLFRSCNVIHVRSSTYTYQAVSALLFQIEDNLERGFVLKP